MRTAIAVAVLAVLAVAIFLVAGDRTSRWEGVDKSVVEKYATAAGRLPRAPWIDTDRGDLLLFLFLLAGAAGGFAGGYFFRDLFQPKDGEKNGSGND